MAPSSGGTRLPRSHRLTKRSEFGSATKTGNRSRDESFNVTAIANNLLHARLGVTVARRVSLKAVTRNRIKRQIRESFRQHQQSLAGFNIVVTANPPAATKDNSELRASLAKHWQRLSKQASRD